MNTTVMHLACYCSSVPCVCAGLPQQIPVESWDYAQTTVAPERHGDPRFYALLDEIAELHSKKNHDYAKTDEPLSNFNRARALGVEPLTGVLVRMTDKWSRIEELSKGKVAKNESLRDSLIDNAVYSLIAVLLLEEQIGK
jgi:hypothetical protein